MRTFRALSFAVQFLTVVGLGAAILAAMIVANAPKVFTDETV